MHRNTFRQGAVIALLNLAAAATYCGVGRVGKLEYFTYSEHTRTLSPAAGLAVAALMIFGLKIWPGILLGAPSSSPRRSAAPRRARRPSHWRRL